MSTPPMSNMIRGHGKTYGSYRDFSHKFLYIFFKFLTLKKPSVKYKVHTTLQS